MPNSDNVVFIDITACPDFWACEGVSEWLLMPGAPFLISIVGGLLASRVRDLILTAFVATLGAVIGLMLILRAKGLFEVVAIDWYGFVPAYVICFVVASVSYVTKHLISKFFVKGQISMGDG